MSKKTNTAVATETAAPTQEHSTRPGPVPVPELRNDNNQALWAALCAHPDSTTGALAHIAGIGLSTARRLLSQWETDGYAQSHTDPSTPRAAKTWTQATDAPATVESDPAPAVPADPGPAEPETPEPLTPEPVSARAATSAGPEPEAPEPVIPEPASSEPDASAAPATVTPATDPAPEVASPGSDVPADPEADTTADTAPAALTGDDSTNPVPAAPTPADATVAADAESTVERLPAGALRGQVEDHLRENPGKEFTPHQIGKALNRSSGAVHNALVKLTDSGTARQTSTAPKKFTLAS